MTDHRDDDTEATQTMYEMYADSWLNNIVSSEIRCSDAMFGVLILYLTLIIGVTGGSIYWLLTSEVVSTLHEMDPEDCVEIPQKCLHFQKLASALHQSELPTWCKESEQSRAAVFEDLLAWMKSELHPNFQDVSVVGDILKDGEGEYENAEPFMRILYEDACRWMSAALAIWTHSPRMHMPCWSGHSFVQWVNGDHEDQADEIDAETDADTVEASEAFCGATENPN